MISHEKHLALRRRLDCATTHVQMKRLFVLPVLLLLCGISAFAKNESQIVMMWPTDNPALKLAFDKFRQQSDIPGQNFYISDVTVENLTDKPIPRVFLTVYFPRQEQSKDRAGNAVGGRS